MRISWRIAGIVLAVWLTWNVLTIAQPVPPLRPPAAEGSTDVSYPPGATGNAAVVLELTVEKTGSVSRAVIIEGDEPFAEHARRAVMTWRFVPAQRGDSPVAARIRARVVFRRETKEPAVGSTAAPIAQKESAPTPSDLLLDEAGAPLPPAEVTIVGARREIGETMLSAGDVREMPGAFGDAFRAIEALPGVAPLVSGIPYFRADSSALWSKHIEGPVEKIVLERGALSIHVDHTRHKGRLLVALPDGELEDMGTTFTVSADDDRTTRVTIEEGSVVLRIHGHPPLTLRAGDAWTPTPPTFPSACASCEPPAPAHSHGRLSLPAAPRATTPRSTAAPPDSSVDFRAAIAALDRGDSSAAAMRFADFLRNYPRDARAEDAAHLRVIALQRAGDAESLKRAAREYLRRYPSGFRRAEVEGLSR